MNKNVARAIWFSVCLGGLSLIGIGAANAATTTDTGSPATDLTSSVGGLLTSTLGGSSAATDVVGDGAPIEGGLVGDALTDVGATLTSGDPAGGLQQTVTDAVDNTQKTVSDLQADSGQVTKIVSDAASDLSSAGAALQSGDPSAAGDALTTTVTHAVDNTADAVDSASLTDDALTNVLGDSDGTAAASTTGSGPLSGLVGANGPIDSTVGDQLLDSVLGSDSPLDPVLGDGSPLADATGDQSALQDIAGDGTLVEGGLVGDAASGGDGLLAALQNGDGVPQAVAGLLQTILSDTDKTVSDAVDGTATTLADTGGVLASGDPSALPSLVNGDVTTRTGLLDPVLADVLGVSTAPTTPTNPTGPTTPTEPTTPVTPTEPGNGPDSGTIGGGPVVVPASSVNPDAGVPGRGVVSVPGAVPGAVGAAVPGVSGLAHTGSDIAGLLSVALLLLMLGGIALALRRRGTPQRA